MAEVFRAVVMGPQEFQRVVVVKRVLPRLSEDPAFLKMFIDEATLCGRLSHPNIIQVHEFGEQDEQPFIAMEYVHGRSLSQLLRRLAERRQPLPFTIAAEIMRQVCRGLAYAHTLCSADGRPLGIVHRDVSPGNVIVAFSGAVKLLDFGIARVEDRFRVGNTQPGQVKGKSAYLAPEQVTSQAVDHRADIFAAGILLFEMVTGRRLFKGTNPLECMNLVTSLPIPQPSQLEPKLPPALETVVLRALRRPREERYQSAGDMADDLESFLIKRQCGSRDLPRFITGLHAEESARNPTQLTRDEVRALSGSPITLRPVTAEITGEVSVARRSSGGMSIITETGRVWRVPHVPRAVWITTALAATVLLGLGVKSAVAPSAPATAALVDRTVDDATSPAISPARASSGSAGAGPASATERPAATAPVSLAIGSAPSGALVFEDGNDQPLGVTPLIVSRPPQAERLTFRFTKAGHVEGVLQVVPDADKPVLLTLTPLAKGAVTVSAPGRRRSDAQKVRHALPINPFSQQ